MPPTSPLHAWRRLLADLAAQQEDEIAGWDGIDEPALARYLVGSSSGDEVARIERILQTSEQLKMLLEHVADQWGMPVAAASQSSEATSSATLWRTGPSGRTLRETLSVWSDAAGRLLAAGLTQWQPPLPLQSSATLGGQRLQRQQWDIPLPPGQESLRVMVHQAADGKSWHVAGELAGAEGTAASVHVQIYRNDGGLEFSAPIEQWSAQPVVLESGEWLASIATENSTWQIPLSLGKETRLPPRS